MAEVTVKINAEDNATATIKKINNEMGKMGQQGQKANKGAVAFTAGLGGAAGTMSRMLGPLAGVAGGIAVLKEGLEFEQEMANVRAVSQATGQEFDQLNNLALELGRTTAFSAKQVAEGMGFLGQAGFKTNQILEATPGVLNLAAAASIDLGTAADITSNVLKGFNKDVTELGHVNDVLVKTTTSSNTNMVQLGQAMGFVAPVSRLAGVSLEETAAAIGLLGDAGIQSSRAGTTLVRAMTSMLSPSKTAGTHLDMMGIKVQESGGKFVGFRSILEQLGTAFEEPRHAANKTGKIFGIFGQRAGPGMGILLAAGADKLRGFTTDLENAGGTAERVANDKLNNLNGKWKLFKSAVSGAAITLTQRLGPALGGILTVITKSVGAVTDFIEGVAKVGEFASHLITQQEDYSKVQKENAVFAKQSITAQAAYNKQLKRWEDNAKAAGAAGKKSISGIAKATDTAAEKTAKTTDAYAGLAEKMKLIKEDGESVGQELNKATGESEKFGEVLTKLKIEDVGIDVVSDQIIALNENVANLNDLVNSPKILKIDSAEAIQDINFFINKLNSIPKNIIVNLRVQESASNATDNFEINQARAVAAGGNLPESAREGESARTQEPERSSESATRGTMEFRPTLNFNITGGSADDAQRIAQQVDLELANMFQSNRSRLQEVMNRRVARG